MVKSCSFRTHRGLGQFGKEAFNSKNIKLRCSSLVADYVMKHPIWKKLIERGNFTFDKFQTDRIVPTSHLIELKILIHMRFISKEIIIKFYFYQIMIAGRKLWILWVMKPMEWFNSLGWIVVLLDGTFWHSDEFKGRVQSNVPHPPVRETLDLIGKRREGDPRIVFIHLNHTTPSRPRFRRIS